MAVVNALQYSPSPGATWADVSNMGLGGKLPKSTLKGWLKQEVFMDDLFGYIMALARIQDIDKKLSRSVQWENWSHNQMVDRLLAERNALLDKYHIDDNGGFDIGRPATINITINL
jgi:hypothetical protein